MAEARGSARTKPTSPNSDDPLRSEPGKLPDNTARYTQYLKLLTPNEREGTLSDRRHSGEPIPVIDLFAGPGGLGEGFSSLRAADGRKLYDIRLSVEMDEHAHRTLELRAFYRQFDDDDRPDQYYEYVKAPSPMARKALFDAFPEAAEAAREEAWQHELSRATADAVKRRVARALRGSAEWILIGGPPCQAYSLVGRSRRKNEDDFETDPKHRLYELYLQILRDHEPPLFVMENVKGILSATLDGQSTIERVLSDLGGAGHAGYDIRSFVAATTGPGGLAPRDFVIKAEDYGIPQARHRVILLGVRRDLLVDTDLLKPSAVAVRAGEVLSDLPRLRSEISRRGHADTSFEAWIAGLRNVSAWARAADADTQQHMSAAIRSAQSPASEELHSRYRSGDFTPRAYAAWYRRDRKLGGLANHEARSHMVSDIQRYLFCASFAAVHAKSPVLADFPAAILPAHENISGGAKDASFADRFRVQLDGAPATTITSHISKDGHYYIHYDASQARSLSVREAARLQTFPDDYFFEGNRTQQYHQVGNAVPPLLARQLGAVVARAMRREPEPPLPAHP